MVNVDLEYDLTSYVRSSVLREFLLQWKNCIQEPCGLKNWRHTTFQQRDIILSRLSSVSKFLILQATRMCSIHQAITRRNSRQVRLLAKVGCNVNRLDSRARSPMRLVCDLDNEPLGISLGRLLLHHGAGVHQKDAFGISVFSYACIKQRVKLVECMIQEREIAWLDQDCNVNTALHHAAGTGNCLITQAIIEQMRRYDLDIDKRNNRGETPLILAERLGHFWCAELLRVCGKASIKARDDVMFNTAEQWRYTCTELTPLKLSSSFRLENST